MEINFEYTVDESDLLTFVNNTVKYASIHKTKKILAVLMTFFLGMLVPRLASPIDRTIFNMVFYGLLVSAIMYPFYLVLVKFIERKRILQKKHLFSGTHVCSLSGEGFSTARLGSHPTDGEARAYQRKHNIKNLYRWDEIAYYTRDNKTLFIYLTNNHVSFIKPDFHIEEVESLFRDKSILKRG